MLVTLVTITIGLMAFVEFCVSVRPFGIDLVAVEIFTAVLLGWLGGFTAGMGLLFAELPLFNSRLAETACGIFPPDFTDCADCEETRFCGGIPPKPPPVVPGDENTLAARTLGLTRSSATDS